MIYCHQTSALNKPREQCHSVRYTDPSRFGGPSVTLLLPIADSNMTQGPASVRNIEFPLPLPLEGFYSLSFPAPIHLTMSGKADSIIEERKKFRRIVPEDNKYRRWQRPRQVIQSPNDDDDDDHDSVLVSPLSLLPVPHHTPSTCTRA